MNRKQVSAVEQRVFALADEVAAGFGVGVLQVILKRQSGSWLLRVTLDSEERTIGIEDCSRVSRALGSELDAQDVIPDRYTLEVSSPGLDRPLLRERDYQRFAGRLARLVTREPIEGRQSLVGRLRGCEDGNVTVEVSGETLEVPLAAIAHAHLEIEL